MFITEIIASGDSNLQDIIQKNSTDALSIVDHGSEMAFRITTPIGMKYTADTTFIGTHSNQYILTVLPKVLPKDLEHFFQSGFWADLRVISHRGEGAQVHFRCKLEHLVIEPVPIIAFSLPGMMLVKTLRKEPRYEVALPAKVIVGHHKLDCEIRDLSRNGCRIYTSSLSKSYELGEFAYIDIRQHSYSGLELAPLEGTICNVERSNHYAHYGLEFTEKGKEHAKKLLERLRFNGTKMTLVKR